MSYAIFGTGRYGTRYYELLKDEYDITCFVDNDPEKQGKKYMGLEVISPERLIDSELTVIIATKYNAEIVKQLLEMNIKQFYAANQNPPFRIDYIDMSIYEDFTEKPNKICCIDQHSGFSRAAFSSFRNSDDYELVIIDEYKVNADYFYQMITSSLIISYNGQNYPGKKSIEIWHGFPIKAVWNLSRSQNNKTIAILTRKVIIDKDVICSLSEFYSVLMANAIKINPDRFTVTGYPRNDLLLKEDSREKLRHMYASREHEKAVIYMPTFRNSMICDVGSSEYSIFNTPGFDILRFNSWLQNKGILFVVKDHPIQDTVYSPINVSNIVWLSNEELHHFEIDLYEMLGGFDCLISDYSSVIIDFLLTDKPMIFTPTDLKEYQESMGITLQPYEAWMPGEIALNYEQLIAALDNALFGEDKYKDDRERLRQSTHKYTDGKSAERVIALAKQILGMGMEKGAQNVQS